MTHEYLVATGGRIGPVAAGVDASAATAIAWAADRVLAVGPDEDVRSISRGDSIFLDLGGCVVTPLPDDPARAAELVRSVASGGGPVDIVELLIGNGLLSPAATLEPGSPADLACWRTDPGAGGRAASSASPRLIALVRAGAFTQGDEHAGPFEPGSAPE
jgi:hypothetical protein